MPLKRKNLTRERYKKAVAELEKARQLHERNEASLIDDKLNRYVTVKKSMDVFEKQWKRLAELKQKLKRAGKTNKVREVESEMLAYEKHMNELYGRLDILEKEITKLNKQR